MKRLFHSQTDAWEVVDQKTVDTVPAFTLQERDSKHHIDGPLYAF